MLQPLFAWSGWSSQVNAALLGISGLIVVAGITYLGVSQQIKSNRKIAGMQLKADADQQHFNRLGERDALIIARQLEVATSFSSAIEHLLTELQRLLELKRDVPLNAAIMEEARKQYEEARRHSSGLALLFETGSMSARTDALAKARACEQAAAVLVTFLAYYDKATRDGPPERLPPIESSLNHENATFHEAIKAGWQALDAFNESASEELRLVRDGASWDSS